MEELRPQFLYGNVEWNIKYSLIFIHTLELGTLNLPHMFV